MQKWGKWRKESNDFALFGVFGSEIKKEGKKDPCLSERTTRGVGISEMSIENSVSRVTGMGRNAEISIHDPTDIFFLHFFLSFPERSLQLLVISSFSFGAMSHFGEMSQTSFR